MDWNPSHRCSFKVDEDALNLLDEIAEREDMNRSEKLRELVRQEVERKGDLDGPTPVLPDNEELADAYQTLHDRAYAPHKKHPRVPLESAKNKLYTNKTPKNEVFDDLLKPLESESYVSISAGYNNVWVVVRPMVYTDGEDAAEPPQEATA